MRIDIIAVGRLKAGPEAELHARYVERIGGMARGLGLSGPRIIELPESQAKRDLDRKAEEGRALLAVLDETAFVTALDERGSHLPSAIFANRIGRQRDDGRKVLQYVIGGADGLDDAVRKRADLKMAIGVMTMPHQLLRIVLAEQLYRACTILAGHPYHRV
jgi:23S rRNA (pseudouridine1915-N3)-methyltransferase